VSRDDWYRNKAWSADIEAAFLTKLARSRSSKPQYLVIQAGYLAENFPDDALKLIDEFLKLPEMFEMPQARCVQARALETKGKVSEAIYALKLALAWEREHPRYLTTAKIDFPMIVAKRRVANEYDEALVVLEERFKTSDFLFPVTRYRWNGCQALIRAELGQVVDARHFAVEALAAATQTESPFRFHKHVGLVLETSDEFGVRVKRLARPSQLSAIFRLIRGGRA